MTARFDNIDENKLLMDFLQRDPNALKEFPQVFNSRILRAARRVARDIPVDIQEEIVSQTFANLLTPARVQFDPSRGTAWQYLIGQILNAEQQVRRLYGFQIRRRNQPKAILESSEWTGQPRSISFELLEIPQQSPNNVAEIFERQFYIQTVLSKAPKTVASVLKQMYVYNKTQKQAIQTLGISRFSYYRKLKKFRSTLMEL